VLSIVEVCVAKLARFSASDRGDIDAMIQAGQFTHELFVTRFQDAVTERTFDARADELHVYIERFHTVERDLFLCTAETEIELPSWV
jgi:hypothetical protein